MTAQTSGTRAGFGDLTQNLVYTWDGLLLSQIDDKTTHTVTTYAFDLAGRHTRERTTLSEAMAGNTTTDSLGVARKQVTQLYFALLNRTPDPAGLVFWSAQLQAAYDAEPHSRAEAIVRFIDGARNPLDQAAFDGRVDAPLPGGETHTAVLQNNYIDYDRLGRVSQVADGRFDVRFDYDNNDNRIRVQTRQAGSYVDAHNTFDAMNRVLTINGDETQLSGQQNGQPAVAGGNRPRTARLHTGCRPSRQNRADDENSYPAANSLYPSFLTVFDPEKLPTNCNSAQETIKIGFPMTLSGSGVQLGEPVLKGAQM